MDQGLFKKHILQIQKNKDSKDEVLLYIQEATGIILKPEEITLSKKNVTVQTSSVKRSQLIQRKTKEILEKKGYSLKL
jgi:hypothetical protein